MSFLAQPNREQLLERARRGPRSIYPGCVRDREGEASSCGRGHREGRAGRRRRTALQVPPAPGDGRASKPTRRRRTTGSARRAGNERRRRGALPHPVHAASREWNCAPSTGTGGCMLVAEMRSSRSSGPSREESSTLAPPVRENRPRTTFKEGALVDPVASGASRRGLEPKAEPNRADGAGPSAPSPGP